MSSITTPRLFATILAASLAACRSVPPHVEPDRALIQERWSGIDRTDGVSEDESVVLAQHHMLSSGLDSDWFVDRPESVRDDGDHWTVEFEPREDGRGSGPRPEAELTFEMLLPCWLRVTKTDGAVSRSVVATVSQ